MIRVPLSSVRKTQPESSLHEISEDGFEPIQEGDRGKRIEARLNALEQRLTTHAEELKSQVTQRVERIQARLEHAMKPFCDDEDAVEEEENVIDFQVHGQQLHHLHATNAKEALNELNHTLKHTREHLDALRKSVDRMRKVVKD